MPDDAVEAYDDAVEAYLETVRPDAHETVRVLARAVAEARAGLDCKVTYRMLVYTFDARWHDWSNVVDACRRLALELGGAT